MLRLVLGGARSGKSLVAERIAMHVTSPVTYVATARVQDDAALERRVAAHRARRPSTWRTVECEGDLAGLLDATSGVVLVDSLGPWLAGQPTHTVNVDELVAALGRRREDTIIVSDEVGLSVHPETEVGRDFRDALGILNQSIATVADEVFLVVAGRVLVLPPHEAS